jgi:dihydrofolate reductase
MQKLIAFNHVSLDGYFVDAHGSMNWAKMVDHDKEWNDFVAENAKGDGALLFGRVTYQLMASYWPTPMAMQNDKHVAGRMNAMPKFVFSKTLDQATWNNTKLLKGDLTNEVRKLKNDSPSGMAILGSGTIISQLASENLIDEFQVIVNAVVLGKGRTMFDGVKEKLSLQLTKTRSFKNGCVFLCYEPAR